MSRLLHGDVGSGKTVVATGAMFQAAASNFQSALMVPTEILAESGHCQSHCAKIDDYQVCDNACSFAPFRRFLLRMRELKFKAAESEKAQKPQ